MREYELIGFVVVATTFQQLPMLRGNVLDAGPEKVGGQGGDSAAILPIAKCRLAVACREHHLFVIAADDNDLATALNFEQAIEHIAGIAALIDQITQEDQLIAGTGVDGAQNGIERVDAAVDIADRDQSGKTRGHGSVLR